MKKVLGRLDIGGEAQYLYVANMQSAFSEFIKPGWFKRMPRPQEIADLCRELANAKAGLSDLVYRRWPEAKSCCSSFTVVNGTVSIDIPDEVPEQAATNEAAG